MKGLGEPLGCEDLLGLGANPSNCANVLVSPRRLILHILADKLRNFLRRGRHSLNSKGEAAIEDREEAQLLKDRGDLKLESSSSSREEKEGKTKPKRNGRQTCPNWSTLVGVS